MASLRLQVTAPRLLEKEPEALAGCKSCGLSTGASSSCSLRLTPVASPFLFRCQLSFKSVDHNSYAHRPICPPLPSLISLGLACGPPGSANFPTLPHPSLTFTTHCLVVRTSPPSSFGQSTPDWTTGRLSSLTFSLLSLARIKAARGSVLQSKRRQLACFMYYDAKKPMLN